MIPLRDENPTEIQPILTVFFIVVCVGVFIWQASQPPRLELPILRAYGLVPAALFETNMIAIRWPAIPAELTVISSMFMHGGWMHLIGNMLYLWIFGNNVEDAMGHVRFFVFYFLCGLAAALAFALPNANSLVPMVGASGAISGVLGAYLLLYPRARILVLIPLGLLTQFVYLPAMLVLGLWIVFQLFSSMLADPNQGGVAFSAHIGGFIAGMVLLPFFKSKKHRLFGR